MTLAISIKYGIIKINIEKVVEAVRRFDVVGVTYIYGKKTFRDKAENNFCARKE